MTSEERLKQAEVLLETAARYINRHSEAIAQNTDTSIRLQAQMSQLASMFSEFTTFVRQNQEEMRVIQQEIRRIWEYLLSQSDNGHSRG